MSREAFEAWIKRDSTLPIDRDGEGYADMDVYLMWLAWQAAQADAFERAAKVCDTHYAGPICAVIFEHENETAQVLAGFIRALAKEAT